VYTACERPFAHRVKAVVSRKKVISLVSLDSRRSRIELEAGGGEKFLASRRLDASSSEGATR